LTHSDPLNRFVSRTSVGHSIHVGNSTTATSTSSTRF